MKKLTETAKKYAQIIRYVVTGGCTTLVNLGVFALLYEVLHLDVTVSNVISIAVAILFAYAVNKIFVFRSRTERWQELLSEAAKFIGMRLTTMAIEVGGVFLFVNILGQDAMLGKVETQVVVLVLNYVISKCIVFQKKDVK